EVERKDGRTRIPRTAAALSVKPRLIAQNPAHPGAIADPFRKSAPWTIVAVRISSAGRVEAESAVPLLHTRDVLGLDEDDLRFRIEDPDGRNAAARSVPSAPRTAATANVSARRTVRSAPPKAAAPATPTR